MSDTSATLEDAVRLLNEQKPIEASCLLEDLIQLGDHSPDLYRQLGLAYLIRGRYEQACESLERVVKASAADPDVLRGLATAHVRLKLNQSASKSRVWEATVENCKELVDDYPDCAEAHVALARAHEANGGSSAAREAWVAALAADPKNGEAHVAIARSDLDEETKVTLETLSKKPDSPHLTWSFTFAHLGMHAQAIRQMVAAIRAGSSTEDRSPHREAVPVRDKDMARLVGALDKRGDGPQRAVWASRFQNWGRTREASTQFVAAFEAGGPSVLAPYVLNLAVEVVEVLTPRLIESAKQDLGAHELALIGRLLLMMGRHDEAKWVFGRSIGKDPMRAEGFSGLAATLANADPKRAMEPLLKAIGLENHTPEDSIEPAPYWMTPFEVLNSFPELRELAKLVDSARLDRVVARARSSGRAALLTDTARLLALSGRESEAVDMLADAVGHDPEHADAYRALNEVSHVLKGRKEVIEKIETAAIRVRSASATVAIARLQHELGKYRQAIDNYERSVRLDPQSDILISWAIALNDADLNDGLTAELKSLLSEKREGFVDDQKWDKVDESRRRRDEEIKHFCGVAERYCDNSYVLWVCASKLFSQQRHDEAARLYRLVTVFDPQNQDAIHDVGAAHSNQGRLRAALGSYEQALRHKSDFQLAHRNAGADRANLGDEKAFSEHFEAAVKAANTSGPESIVIGTLVAWAAHLATFGRFEEAVEKLNVARNTKGGDVADSVHFQLGYSWSLLGDNDKAWDSYDEAVRVLRKRGAPYTAYPLFNIAELLDEEGRYEESHRKWYEVGSAFKEELLGALDMRDVNFLSHYGTYLNIVARNRAEAEAVYRAALALRPEYSKLYAGLVSVYVEMKREARTDSELRKGPELPSEATIEAKAYQTLRRGEVLLEKNIKEDENATVSLIELGKLYLLMDKFEAAKMHLEKACELKPKSRAALVGLGRAHMGLKEPAAAVRCFRRSLGINDDPDTRVLLAGAYLAAKDLEKAEQEFERIREKNKSHAKACIGLGNVYLDIAESMTQEDRKSKLLFQAADFLSEGMKLAQAEANCSMKQADQAAANYSLGFANGNLYVLEDWPRDRRKLKQARNAFVHCLKWDNKHIHARRALELLTDRRSDKGRSILEAVVPWVIAGIALTLLMLAQLFYYWGPDTVTRVPFTIAGEKLSALHEEVLNDIERQQQQLADTTVAASTEVASLDEIAVAVGNAFAALKKNVADVQFVDEKALRGKLDALLKNSNVGLTVNGLVELATGGEERVTRDRMDKVTYLTITFGSLLFLMAGAFLPFLTHFKFGGLQFEKITSTELTSPGGSTPSLELSRPSAES